MADKHPNAPRGHTVGADWPAWRYGPDGQARIFATASEVPVGWCSRQDMSDPKEAPVVAEEQIVDVIEPSPIPAAVAAYGDAMVNDALAAGRRRPLTLKRTPG